MTFVQRQPEPANRQCGMICSIRPVPVSVRCLGGDHYPRSISCCRHRICARPGLLDRAMNTAGQVELELRHVVLYPAHDGRKRPAVPPGSVT